MSLVDWHANRWIVSHEPSVEEISDLFAVIDRDLDAAVPRLSDDWRLGIAYNAALQLATLALVATALRGDVVRWLRKKHRSLYPADLKL